jgi:putative copper export protein
MLAVNWDTIRLFLHVVAATIWVGGQITLAALVPVLRKAGSEVSKAAANGFNRIAWPAFGVLIVTGIWNVTAVSDDNHGNYAVVLGVKMAVVGLSGVAALLHTRATTRKGLAIWGALSGLSALTALVLGVLLAG